MDAAGDGGMAVVMVDAQVDPEADVLTQAQQRLLELSTKMMTYVGVLQRDAPALEPSSGESGDPNAVRERALREHSMRVAESYARDVAESSARLDALFDRVRDEIEVSVGSESETIRRADADAMEATEELERAVLRASSMLSDLRGAIDQLDLPLPHLPPARTDSFES
mmetsp:Transcript_15394/g.41327  ORF Transcript_15394/g.41327 Transcript_15394/m.41327 type:complete len:168 (+) Transcript_15394:252-755(+)|eukprot:CAMPEP_0185841168 /NCGR_PEP_ID=MMETSP1353-20130828/17462_1 /TAXON_ID=1077150 /ORGANISM="Erythrolobus australicus, Strain CCMP3124" /LENGTH=167 /DNA_ID=CAMNT_0028540587 /DNA_START=231 /DNA_END=734 /DNA_ORIENTATION=-